MPGTTRSFRMQKRSLVAGMFLIGLLAAGMADAAAPKKPPPSRTAAVAAAVTILKPVSLATGVNLTTGSVATTKATVAGTETIPASYPTLKTPAPAYSGAKLSPISGKITQPTAARIDITGVAGTSVTVHVTGWRYVSGGASAPTLTGITFYSPSYGTKASPVVVLDARGKGSLYVGATLSILASVVPHSFNFSPVFSVNYN